MNNPLYRKMFQQPGASKQPAGILASSPDLANVVQQRQPVRMANGGSPGLQSIVDQLTVLKQSGDIESLRKVANSENTPQVIKTIASNFADSLLPDSAPLIEVGDVNLGNALSDATNRNPIGQSAGGQERSAALKEVPSKIGDELTRVRGPALKDVEGSLPDSPFKNMLDMFRSDASAAPQPVQSPPEFTPSTTMDSSTDSMSRIGSSMPQAMLDKIRAARGLPPVAATTDSLVGSARVTSPTEEGIFSVLAKNQTETVQRIKDGLYDETGADVNLGVRVTPSTPGETLADSGNMYGVGDFDLGEALSGTATPTQNSAAKDAGESTDDEFKPNKRKVATTTDAAIKKIEDNVANFTGGSFNQSNVKKLTDKELSNEAVLADLTPIIAGLTDPKEVDIEAIDKKVNDLTGFDPKKAGKGKETAFWMGLMKAGLAMAAGESDNALTNIAKGLSFGLDSYGKDINNLNEQEREDRKERAALKLQMINSDRAYNLSMAGIKNTHEMHKVEIQNQFKRDKVDFGFKTAKANLEARQLEANIAQARATLQVNAIAKIESLKQGRETIALDRDKLAATIEAGRPKEIKLFKELKIIDNNNKATDFGIKVYGDEVGVLNAVLSQAKTGKTGAVAPTRERYILDSLGKEFALDAARQDMFSRGIEKPTGDQYREYFGKQYDATTAGSGSATPPPGATAAQRNPDIEAKGKAAGLSLKFDPSDGAYYYTLPNGDFEKFTGE